MKKQICILLAALLVLSLAGCGVRDEPPEERIIPEIEETDTSSVETFAVAEQPEKEPENEPKRISGWSEGSPAMAEIIASVESITDEASPDYVPPEKRIALFDFDGTLVGERYPTYSDRSMLLYRLLHDDTYHASKYVAFARATEKAIANCAELPPHPLRHGRDVRGVICGLHRGRIQSLCEGV